MSEFVHRPRAWLLVALLLAGYIGLSSVLGLVLLIMSEGLLGVLLVWSTSIAADIVFVIGSIAGAVAGVTLARSRRSSIALTAVITSLTYGIAAEIALIAFSGLAQGTSPAPSPDNLPNLGIVLADAPLLGLAGVAFASVAPTLLRERVRRLLAPDAEPPT
jgi:Na+-transporting NADH:ubiquinone oxidoreductase subunit NqrE